MLRDVEPDFFGSRELGESDSPFRRTPTFELGKIAKSSVEQEVAKKKAEEEQKAKEQEAKKQKETKEEAKDKAEKPKKRLVLPFEKPDETKEESEKPEKPETEKLPLSQEQFEEVKETLSEEIEELEAQVESAPEGSVEEAEAQAALALVKGVDEKFDNPEREFSEDVEVEFARRVAEITEQDSSTPESGTELPPLPLPELPSPPPAELPEEPENTDASAPKEVLPPLPDSESSPDYGLGVPDASMPGATLSPRSIETAPATNTTETKTERSTKREPLLVVGGLFEGIRRGRSKSVDRKPSNTPNTYSEVVQKAEQLLEQREIDIRHIARENFQRTTEQPRPLYERKPEQPRTTGTEQKSTDIIEKPTPPKFAPVHDVLRQAVSVPDQLIAPKHTTAPETAKDTLQPLEKKQIETLSTPELLKHAEKLYIEGISVRTLYETNQLDRRGLITIVRAAIRGESIKEAFKKTELGRERQRERANEFRHDPVITASSIATAQSIIGASDDIPLSASAQALRTASNSLPNTPDPSKLEPLSQAHPLNIPLSADDELEPLDTAELHKLTSIDGRVIALIGGGIVGGILLIWLLLSLL